ncbi:MAG: nucleotidyl transferase AbiEii/AbiGii toxin family protein [Acidobacteriaceae bacterium]
MSDKVKYATGAALRAALEERLKQITKTEGAELQRLRRQVAFDRFLARLFHGTNTQWVLKGGYAMELRFQVARATKDLDFTVRTGLPDLLRQLDC